MKVDIQNKTCRKAQDNIMKINFVILAKKCKLFFNLQNKISI